MRIATDNPGLKLLSAAAQPLLISGTPARLQGALRVQNATDERLTLNSMRIASSDIPDARLAQLGVVPITGRLEPNAATQVDFQFAVDSTTPPGEYSATITVGGAEHPARIVVAGLAQLEIDPDSLTLFAAKTRRFERTLALTNRGNVPLPLGAGWEAALRPPGGMEEWVARALTAIAGGGGKQGGSLDALLQSLSSQSPGVAQVTWPEVVLQPGETQQLATSIVLPQGLPEQAHFAASLPLYATHLSIDIYTRA